MNLVPNNHTHLDGRISQTFDIVPTPGELQSMIVEEIIERFNMATEVTITLKLTDEMVEEIRKHDPTNQMSAVSYQCTTELLRQTIEGAKAEIHKKDNANDE